MMYRYSMLALLAVFTFSIAGCDSTDPGPRAAFAAQGRFGPAPRVVQFSDTSNPGEQTIMAWAWAFGDDSTSTERHPEHTYAAEGKYNVSLTITLDNGETRSRTEVAFVVVDDTFARTFGGAGIDDGLDILQSTDKNVVIVGASTPDGEDTTDLYLAKADIKGELLWEMRFGDTAMDIGRAVVEGTAEDLIVAGTLQSPGINRNRLFVLRTNEDGEEVWSRQFGDTDSQEGYALLRVLEGTPSMETFTVAGTFRPLGSFERDFFVTHLDKDGEILWTSRIETPGDEEVRAIAAVEAGGYVVLGTLTPTGSTTSDIYAVRIDAAGETVWAEQYGDLGNDQGFDAIANGAGFLLTGSSNTLGTRRVDLVVTQIDGDGLEVWSTLLGGTGTEQGWGLLEAANGNFLASGFTTSSTAGAEDAILARLDTAGNELWRRTLGGSGLDILRKGLRLTDGFLWVGSTASFGAGERDIYLVKTDAEGFGPSDPDV
ncbi:MAG: PKD domain-containing protein [Candidatus Hydrogenedentes bacterium]|nr:PKD domain-containing protein [Candidatus Hydrogenedentota bacterium]